MALSKAGQLLMLWNKISVLLKTSLTQQGGFFSPSIIQRWFKNSSTNLGREHFFFWFFPLKNKRIVELLKTKGWLFKQSLASVQQNRVLSHPEFDFNQIPCITELFIMSSIKKTYSTHTNNHKALIKKFGGLLIVLSCDLIKTSFLNYFK